MTADLIFRGGPVFTAAATRAPATAVAVRGDRIIAVGHERDDWVTDLTRFVRARTRQPARRGVPRKNAHRSNR